MRHVSLSEERVPENFRTFSVGRLVGYPRLAHYSTGIVAISSTAANTVSHHQAGASTGYTRSQRVRIGVGQDIISG